MERIKQAIEKAKQQTSSGAAVRPKIMPLVVQSAELSELSYVQTKVVSLSPEHLERNRIVAYNKNSNMSWAFDLLRTQDQFL